MKSLLFWLSVAVILFGFSITSVAQTITPQVSAGSHHNLVLTENGDVFGFGRNDVGALGLGDANRVDIPHLVNHPNLTGKTVIDVAIGGDGNIASYILLLTDDGQVFSFGITTNGMTGHPEGPTTTEPTRITAGGVDTVFVNAVAVGNEYTTLATNRGLYVFGSNANGYIGVGNNINPIAAVTRLTQENVNLLPFKKIYNDYQGSTFGITENDSIFVWGRNSNGELGVGDFINRLNPTPLSSGAFGGQKVVKFAGGNAAYLALTQDGKAYFTGLWRGYHLEAFDFAEMPRDINVPTRIEHSSLAGKTFVDIAIGYSHGLLLDDEGTVYSFGENNLGQLGFSDPASKTIPTPLDQAVFQNKAIVKIYAGTNQSYFIADDGTIFATGDGSEATLGLGYSGPLFGPLPLNEAHYDNKTIQHISPRRQHVFFVANDGSFYSAGDTYFRSLQNTTTTSFLMRERPSYAIPTQLNLSGLAGAKVSKIRAGERKSFFVTTDGRVYGMGLANFGGLGIADSLNVFEPVLLDQTHLSGKRIIDVATSGNTLNSAATVRSHTLLLADDGTIYGFGSNNNGQLGLADNTNRRIATPITTNLSGKTIIHIAVGPQNSMAIASDGSVYLWGRGGLGEMGFGNTDDLNVPTLATHVTSLGKTFVKGAIGTGTEDAPHFILLASDGTVYGFGENSRGQLGLGNGRIDQYIPTQLTAASLSGKKIIDVSTSIGSATMLVAETGEVFAMGSAHTVGFPNHTFSTFDVPTLVNSAEVSGRRVKGSSVFNQHSILLMEDGRVLTASSLNGLSGREGVLGNTTTPSERRLHLPVLNFTTYANPIPTDNLALHLDAERVGFITANDSVNTWQNLADGTKNAVHPGLNLRPVRADSAVNNRPVMRFNGTNSYLTLPSASDLDISNKDYEMFVVAKSSSANIQFLLGGETFGEHELHLNGASGVRFIPVSNPAHYVDVGTTGSFTNGQAQMYNVQASQTSGIVSVNRSQSIQVNTSAHSANSGPIYLGRRRDNTFLFNGDIAEVIIYNGTLSESDRARVEDYLITKYNLPNQIQTSLTLSGTEGWRLLSTPVANSTFAPLLSNLWTQGFTGASTEFGTPNVYTWNTSSTGIANTNWTALDNMTTPMPPGAGALVYVFSDDNYDEPGNAGFPKVIQVNGAEPVGEQNLSARINTNVNGWTLLGNPFRHDIRWNGFSRSALSNAVYVYDANSSAWRTWNGTTGTLTNGRIGAFNAFFVETLGATPQLRIASGSKTFETGSFLGKSAGQDALAFSLQATHEGGLSNSSWFAFSQDSQSGLDPNDAHQLVSLGSSYVMLASVLNDSTHLDINSLPMLADITDIPVHLATTESGRFTITLADVTLPGDWSVTLTDTHTGVTSDLQQPYHFTVDQPVAKSAPQDPLRTDFPLISAQAQTGAPRFVVTIRPGTTTSIEDYTLPTEVALSQNYPNPFNPTTTIAYALPETAPVRLDVFDMLGRRVATLVNTEAHAPGSHAVSFDASRLTSGVYVYRLQAGSTTITRKFTLIK
jgi:alpha-tubulin suppressor-like RCC1 family protein